MTDIYEIRDILNICLCDKQLEEEVLDMKEREIALWGGGFLCRNWLDGGFDKLVNVVIDNNPERASKVVGDKKIVAPNDITNWKSYFIIITSNYYDEISEQLSEYGLIKGVDYVSYIDYMCLPPEMKGVTEAICDIVFDGEEEKKEILEKVYTREEYKRLCEKYCKAIKFESALNKLYQKKKGKRVAYHGYCDVCKKDVDFSVDYIWTDGSMPAWRETVFCPYCNCNSRMRFMIQRISDQYSGTDAKVYICEQVTRTYNELKKKLPNIVGSEYLGDTYKSGDIIDEIMHQDVMNLSFADESFDCIASLDVYEHIADFRKAFMEAYRCLKSKGKLLFSIPLFKDKDEIVLRTKIKDGKLEYLLPKVYHGNPLSEDGSLVFTDFGWDILDVLRDVGFSDVYAIVYFSVKRGYFGELPIVFEAIK